MPATRLLDAEVLAERARDAWRSAMPSSWRATPGLADDARPAHWAARVRPDLPGVENLWRVTDLLYRAGQPSRAGFRTLESFGIQTVISLRQTVSDLSLAAGTGLALHRIPMKSRYVAENRGDRIVRAMRCLNAGVARGPVLVHCHHGSDRTGLIVALWRILYEGWSRQQALDELIAGGYGYHPIWANIPRYLRKVDLKDLRARIEGWG
jgi:protein tyrosine/serine phosphatase